MKLYNKALPCFFVLLSLFFGNYLSARGLDTGKNKQSKSEKKEKSDYEKLFSKKHDVKNGLFVLHLVDSKLYFEVPLKLLNKEMMLGSTVAATSDNGNGIVGAKHNDPLCFALVKENNSITMRLIDNADMFCESDYGSLSPNQIKSGAIFKLFKIECYNRDSSAVVINVNDLFLGDDKQLSPFDKYSMNTLSGSKERTETFEKDKSFIEGIKAFSDNISVRSSLSYKYTISGRGLKYKNVPFTASVVRSIILLDSIPYAPRITDSRIGIFPTEKLSYSAKYQGSKKVYFANRWKLQPKDTAAYLRGELVEPVKPIVFYVDTLFPKKWIPSIHAGVEQWNELFEKIGFKNAIKAVDFPRNNKEFDPDNIKYSCIRYAPIQIQNAMGPSWTDPRSGEIICASVYLYHDVIELINNWLFVQTSQVDKRVRHTIIPDDIIYDALRYVLSHEVGHCLGFMHNMSASYQIPTDSLRSASYTNQYGTTTSIMDYARFNYVAQPEDSLAGLKLTPPHFGYYDGFLVRWNYTPLFNKTTEEDRQITSQWLSDAYKNPINRYGKQQDDILDPRSQTEDLGNDAIKSSSYGINNLKYIMLHFNDWLNVEDADYKHRRLIYEGIITQYLTEIGHVFYNIGGIYINDKFSNEPGNNYQSVDFDYQQKSMAFLLGQLGDIAWLDNEAVLRHLPVMEPISNKVRNYLMQLIMSAPGRTELSAAKSSNPYTPQYCIQQIFDAVWSGEAFRRGLTRGEMQNQRLFFKKIVSDAGYKLHSDKGISLAENLKSIENSITSEYKELKQSAGYEQPEAMYFETNLLPGDAYKSLMDIQKILEKNIHNRDKATAVHCMLLLKELDNALKTTE
jgi:hypothetical protein